MKISNILDSEWVRSLPDLHIGNFVIWRSGWNFKPDWDKTLWQKSFGKWWIWCGPYIIGWYHD